MRKINRGVIRALQRYSPESKADALRRAECDWRLNAQRPQIEFVENTKENYSHTGESGVQKVVHNLRVLSDKK